MSIYPHTCPSNSLNKYMYHFKPDSASVRDQSRYVLNQCVNNNLCVFHLAKTRTVCYWGREIKLSSYDFYMQLIYCNYGQYEYTNSKSVNKITIQITFHFFPKNKKMVVVDQKIIVALCLKYEHIAKRVNCRFCKHSESLLNDFLITNILAKHNVPP